MISKLYLNAGQMKAGTTFLYALLKQHPKIYFTPEKEIHFLSQHFGEIRLLSDRVRLTKAQALIKSPRVKFKTVAEMQSRLRWLSKYLEPPTSIAWYESLYEGLRPDQFGADFSNLTCTIPPEGLREIRSIMPNTWITYCVRDPVARAFSHIKFHLRVAGVEGGVSQISESRLRALIRSRDILPQCETEKHVENLLSVFGEGRFRLVKCEEMWRDPQSTVDGVCRFLGLEPQDVRSHSGRAVNVGPVEELGDRVLSIISQELRSEIEGTYRCLEIRRDLLVGANTESP